MSECVRWGRGKKERGCLTPCWPGGGEEALEGSGPTQNGAKRLPRLRWWLKILSLDWVPGGKERVYR